MSWMYCSHAAYCTTLRCSNSHHQSSSKRSWQSEVELNLIILDVPTFTTSRLPRDPSSQRWNYVGEKWPMNFAWNARLPLRFRNLLHAVNLHGTDGFTSPPKEGVLRIFLSWKIRRLRSGLNPRTCEPKASTLPLDHRSRSAEVKNKWRCIFTPPYASVACTVKYSTLHQLGHMGLRQSRCIRGQGLAYECKVRTVRL